MAFVLLEGCLSLLELVHCLCDTENIAEELALPAQSSVYLPRH